MSPMSPVLLLLWLSQGATAALAVDKQDDSVLTTSLASDSECQGEGTCALNALQVKQQALSAQQVSAEMAAEQEVEGVEAKQAEDEVAASADSEELGISLAASCSRASTPASLIRCAEDTVSQYGSQISRNLRKNGISKLDLGWPGTGFNQAAFGGQYQTLMAVERLGGFRVENIVGASGGASSAILALVDRRRSAETMMKTLMSSSWGSVSTSGEYSKYKSLLQSGDWAAVQRRGYASVVCDSKSSVSSIVYDFSNRDQAAKAFAASGDIPSVLTGLGYSLGGQLSHCHDGGELMGVGRNPFLYYNTDYGYNFACSKTCAISLFKKGVQATITALTSSNLRVGSSGGGSMAIQKPRGSWRLSQYRNWLSSGGFYEILTTGSSSPRNFVRGSSLSSGGWR